MALANLEFLFISLFLLRYQCCFQFFISLFRTTRSPIRALMIEDATYWLQGLAIGPGVLFKR